MKRRIDYERLPVPHQIGELGLRDYAEAESLLVMEWHDQTIGLVLDVPGVSFPVSFSVDSADEADKMIAALIAARNKFWPQS